MALSLLLQAVVLPVGLANASIPPCEPVAEQSCCDQASCCCGDPDICLCIAECPDAPLMPTRDGDPARPTELRAEFAIPSGTDAVATPMPFTPRIGAVLQAAPRPASPVRAQAILSIWLT